MSAGLARRWDDLDSCSRSAGLRESVPESPQHNRLSRTCGKYRNPKVGESRQVDDFSANAPCQGSISTQNVSARRIGFPTIREASGASTSSHAVAQHQLLGVRIEIG